MNVFIRVMFPAKFVFDLYLPKHSRYLSKDIISSMISDLYGSSVDIDAKTKAMVDELYRRVSLNDKGIKRSDFKHFCLDECYFLTPILTLQSKLCSRCVTSECLTNIRSVRSSLFSGKYMTLEMMIPLLMKDPFDDNYLQVCKTSGALKAFGSFVSQSSEVGLKHASSDISDTSTIDVILPEARKYFLKFSIKLLLSSHFQDEEQDDGDITFRAINSPTEGVMQVGLKSSSCSLRFSSLQQRR